MMLDNLIVGTCILETADQIGGDAQKVSCGIIYCGICSRVKKYRLIPEVNNFANKPSYE